MKKSYDYRGADSLVPLLQVLNREIEERNEAIRQSLRRVRQLRRTSSRDKSREQSLEEASLQAEIATHKREIRFTKKELTRLGCIVDAEDPSTVLIPGKDGNLEGGFAWRSGDSRVHAHVEK